MMKRTFILLIVLLTTFSGRAADTDILSLNGTWKFILAKTEKEADALSGFYTPEFDSRQFSLTPVPSNWAIQGYEEPVYRGFENDKASQGFYLYEFATPQGWSKKRMLLHFGGVWSSAEVWLNGVNLGRHDSGYTSFAFDVTSKLKEKGLNLLAVRVRQTSREYKFDVFDDWTLGGIYRDVTLEAMPRQRWLDQVIVQTTFDKQFEDADLKIRTMVSDRHKTTLPGNYPSPGNPYELRFTLSTKDGKEVACRQITIPAHTATDREVNLTMHIASPHHWTAETPYLYHLRIDLLEKDGITHTRTERVGFRQISTDGGIFRINGQAVKLRGVNRHDEHPDVGRATRHEHWLQDIKLMKAANINYIRLSHYTPAKGFIELCDELGMYVGNEVSLGGAGNRMHDPSYSGAVLVRSYETIVRDINNPSIVYWSIGNEDPLTSLHLASIKLVKALDPTRPVLIPWRSEEWLPGEIDILSSHYWHPHEYDKLAGHANRPVITTEYTHAFGTHAFGGLEARWKALTQHPSGTGAAIWMWADQGLKTPVKRPKGKYDKIVKDDDYLRIDDAGWDGIVDSYRNATRDYWETKAVYAPVYPSVNEVFFAPGQPSVRIPIQNDYDFTDLNTVSINWSIWEDECELISGTHSISGQPHAVSIFELPMENLKTICHGKTYYARFIFTDANGVEINRKVVELKSLTQAEKPTCSAQKLHISKGKMMTVEAGDTHYVFDSTTGHLTSATLNGKPLITDLKPIIWHHLDHGETSVIGSKIARNLADLNRYTSSVTAWNIEEKEDRIVIHAKVKYSINKQNRFTTIYCYSISSDGKLKVHYEISPEVETPHLPVVGMSLQTVPSLNNIHWLGLGPYDAYPNKQSAPVLGVWGGIAGSKEVIGNKATRWIERTGLPGKVHISHLGYMEHNVSAPETIHLLSDVLSKPEKGRKPDDSFPLLQAKDGLFIGEFSIMLEEASTASSL